MKYTPKYVTTRLAESKDGQKLNKTVKEWHDVDKAVAYARRYSHTVNFYKVTVECPEEAEGYKVLFELESHGIVTVDHLGTHKDWLKKQEELAKENNSLPAEPEIESYEVTVDTDDEDIEFKKNVVYVSDKPGKLTFDAEVTTGDGRKAFDYIWLAIGKYLATQHHDYAEGIYKDWCPDEEFSDIETYPEIMAAQNSYKDADDFYNDYGLKVYMQINDDTVYVCINVSNGDEYAKAKDEEVKADRVAESGAAVATFGTMMEVRETMDTLGAA